MNKAKNVLAQLIEMILSFLLMDKTPLVDFFERTDFNNVKELVCPLFPGLFDYYLTCPDFNGTLMIYHIRKKIFTLYLCI